MANTNRRCNLCDFTTANQKVYAGMWKHKRTQHFECQKCFKICQSLKDLLLHEKTAHYRADGKTEKLKKYECTKCDDSFADPWSLRRHSETLCTKIQICDECGKRFCTMSGIRKHCKMEHEQKVIKHPCKHCDFSTAHKYDLQFHRAVLHFDCLECDTVQNSLLNLFEHQKSKHPNREKSLVIPYYVDRSGLPSTFTNYKSANRWRCLVNLYILIAY